MGIPDGTIQLCGGTGLAKASGHLFAPCCSACWFCLGYVVYGPPGGVGGITFAVFSVRSASPQGTVLNIPINRVFTYVGASPVRANFTVPVTVGDNSKTWVSKGLTTDPASGHAFNVYTYSVTPPANSPYCLPPGYCLPMASYLSGGGTARPIFDAGLVRWDDLEPHLEADMPGMFSGGSVCTGSAGDANWACFLGWPNTNISATSESFETWSDPALTAGPYWSDNYGSNIMPSADATDVALDSVPVHYGQRRRAWNQASFSAPAGPLTVDSLFDLTVTFYNPFTGNLVDGSHAWTNAQEVDTDTDPFMEIMNRVDTFDDMSWSSISRTSFGVYVIHDAQFFCKAGSRQFNVWGWREHTTNVKCSAYKIACSPINVDAGAPDCVDLVRINGTDRAWFRVNGPILGPGATDVHVRIMDQFGEVDIDNVCPAATNSVTMSLLDDGSNDWAGPTLNGTNPKAAVAGVASFSDLNASALGNNYRLKAAAAGLTFSANGDKFPVGFTAGLKFHAIAATAGVDLDVKVDLVDYANVLVNPGTQDALTLSGAGGFTGFGTQTPVAGTATFHGNFPAAGTYVIQVVTSGTHYNGPGVTYGTPTMSDPPVTISVVVS